MHGSKNCHDFTIIPFLFITFYKNAIPIHLFSFHMISIKQVIHTHSSDGIGYECFATSRRAVKEESLRRTDAQSRKQFRMPHMQEKLANFSETVATSSNVREANSGALYNKL